MSRKVAFEPLIVLSIVTLLCSLSCTGEMGAPVGDGRDLIGEVPVACDPDDLANCPQDTFICQDDGAGGKICLGQEPAVPDEGAWSCDVVDGELRCVGDHLPSGAAGWACVSPAEGTVVCTHEGYVPDGGGDAPWDCSYQGEMLLCVTEGDETPPDDGEAPPDDGEAPPDDGETPPDDGETPPDDGETPPDDGETPPDDGGIGCGPGQTPPPELCDNGVDDDCDGLADCDDDACACDPLREGCRASERIAFIQGDATLADVRPGAFAIDVFSAADATATALAGYDTVVYYGNPDWGAGGAAGLDCATWCSTPGFEAWCTAFCGGGAGGGGATLLEDLYRAGVKVIILSRPSASYYVPPVMELNFHVHDLALSGSVVTATDSNTMSDAFVQTDFDGWTMLQYHADTTTPWCGDLFFETWGYNGHFHGFRRDDAVYRGILVHFGIYNTASSVVDFSNSFLAAQLEQLWDPGFGLSDACGLSCDMPVGHGVGKPVIYLYPEEEQEVTVNLDFDGELVTTYPAYSEEIGGWNVIARPDGTMINQADGQEYSYIYWNGVSSAFLPDFSTGFVVAGEDTVEFLQTTLAEMGLIPAEYNELIVYWLPYMEHHRYNLVHFAGSEYTDIARMTITPEPDSLLRVFMVFRELDEPVSIPEQTFAPFEREGFTVVEWGGSEIGGDWHVVR